MVQKELLKCRLNDNDIWCVEIEERPKHLWPGKWTVGGWYEDEKKAFTEARDVWEARRDKEWWPGPAFETMPDGRTMAYFYDDEFHWNVGAPHRWLCTDGDWHRMLIDDKNKMIGEYNSYEEGFKAVEEAIKKGNIPPRTNSDYCNMVWEVARNYVFIDKRGEKPGYEG